MYSWHRSAPFLFSTHEQTNLSHMPTCVEDVGHSATYFIFFQMLMQSHSWPACIWHRRPEGLKTVSHPVQNTVVAPCLLTYNFQSSSGSMQKKAAHAWTLDRMVSSGLCPHWRGGEHVFYSVLPPWGLCTVTCLKWSCAFVRNPRIALVSPLSNVLAYAVT